MRLSLVLMFPFVLGAQQPEILTLAEAESIAIRNHPRIAAANSAAEASQETARQIRAGLSPLLSANLTASVAEHETRLGAGQLNPSSLFSRTAAGLNISQVIFDFGRARTLANSARSRAAAQTELTGVVRAEVLLRVREAYYRGLLAETGLRVARDTVEARRLTLRQISTLAASNLRSTLDVSFAELNLSEAELVLDRSENDARASLVHLAAALGSNQEPTYQLRDEPIPNPLDGGVELHVAEALRSRPELASLRMNFDAAKQFAESERRQSFPVFSGTAVGGFFGVRDARLRPHYGAIGVNLNIPVFNGSLFTSRRREAEFKAEVANQEVRDLEIRTARDVRAAWIDAENANKRLASTAKLLEHAGKTLRLAQTRYDLGLSSIVELNQAQLSRAVADVTAASAKYEYLIKRAILDYHSGALR